MILFDVGVGGFVAGYYDFQLFGRAETICCYSSEGLINVLNC